MNAWDESFAQNRIIEFCGRWPASEDLPCIKRLMLAVLQDALECVAGRGVCIGGANARRTVLEAANWIADKNDSEIFSFNSVCEVLGLDVAAVRRALIEWRVSGIQMSPRPPVARESVKLSLNAYRKRRPPHASRGQYRA